MLTSLLASSQTYLKVADTAEFVKFMNYCQTPVPRTFYMYGEVSVVKYNPDYTNPLLNYAQPNGDWMAKYPLVIKWYGIDSKVVKLTEAYQHRIIAKIDLMVPRIYCTSKTEYITLFYAHWKNNDILDGWIDKRCIAIWDFNR